MTVELKRRARPCDPRELQELETAVGRPLPSDYVAFLRSQNGGRPESNVFGPGEKIAVRSFLGAREVIDTKRGPLASRLSKHAWPIADDGSGNRILLRWDGEWAIWFWDHELEAEDDPEAETKIAPSFSALLEGLRPY